MSVVIAVKVSEGLVLGADSAATLSGRFESPEGVQEGILQTFYNARKLMQIGDFPIGVLTWGHSFIGLRTIESLVREWEHDHHWQSREIFHKESEKKFSVRDCARGLLKHLSRFHRDEYGEKPNVGPQTGVLVSGYSEGKFFPELWRFVVPFDRDVHNQRPDVNGKPDFGASWFGLTEPIIRLHFGRSDEVIKTISEKFDVPESEVSQLLAPLQYQVPFAQMPLQDAIDYAEFMLGVAIGRFRFVIGPELCGGDIDIAAITQRSFNWISKKTLSRG